MKFMLDTPPRRVIVVFTNHFDFPIFSELCKLAHGQTSYFSLIMPTLTSNSVSLSLRMLYQSCVKVQELHCPAKTEQKLTLRG